MTLLASNPLEEIADRPWDLPGLPHGMFSSQIACMILAGLILMIVFPLLARRRVAGRNGFVGELFLTFVRDNIARPAMGDQARMFTPYLATLLGFLLMVNLLGLVPLLQISELMGLHSTPVGGTATSSIRVTGAMAGVTLLLIMGYSYWLAVKALWKGRPGHGHDPHEQASDGHAGHADDKPRAGANLWLAAATAIQGRTWPLPVAIVLGLPVWLNSFVPAVPGVIGLILWPVLLGLEFIGHVARCGALCIRLFANMVSGHILLATLIVLAAGAGGWALLYAGLPSGAGAVAILALEVFVAVVHAYIFTFLTGVFIGLVSSHGH